MQDTREERERRQVCVCVLPLSLFSQQSHTPYRGNAWEHSTVTCTHGHGMPHYHKREGTAGILSSPEGNVGRQKPPGKNEEQSSLVNHVCVSHTEEEWEWWYACLQVV